MRGAHTFLLLNIPKLFGAIYKVLDFFYNFARQISGLYYSKVIAQFPISGWIPNANNISVTVTYKDETTKTGSTFYTIPFPEVGQVPMMFATDPSVFWMVERQDFPTWWLENHSDTTE